MNEYFRRFAARTGEATASPWAFLIAVSIVVIWGITGPFFNFSDTWQLTINTTASIVPSLMVFLLQNTQSRDTKEIQLKLDELIRAVGGTRPTLINLEALSDEELSKLQAEFQRLTERTKPDARSASDEHFKS
jgi:low affinity Fe/Cu permease